MARLAVMSAASVFALFTTAGVIVLRRCRRGSCTVCNPLTVNGLAICRLSHCKRPSIRRRKATFYKLKGGLLQWGLISLFWMEADDCLSGCQFPCSFGRRIIPSCFIPSIMMRSGRSKRTWRTYCVSSTAGIASKSSFWYIPSFLYVLTVK